MPYLPVSRVAVPSQTFSLESTILRLPFSCVVRLILSDFAVQARNKAVTSYSLADGLTLNVVVKIVYEDLAVQARTSDAHIGA
ncbi:MAG: hypothetical protein V1792_25235 [Pseudomonadota bacterium]